jgi:hypothetical protein
MVSVINVGNERTRTAAMQYRAGQEGDTNAVGVGRRWLHRQTNGGKINCKF